MGDPDAHFRADLLKAVPSLRAFAISLTADVDKADDLVQETVVRALGAHDRFEAGSNLTAWLFTILRNQYYTAYRKRRREVEDPDGSHMARLVTAPPQEAWLEWADFLRAFQKLNANQREALILFVAEGLSLEEVAAVMGVALGTAKSRIIRARARLQELLNREPWEVVGPSPVVRAVLRAAA